MFKQVVLGIIQGIGEWLPVSSSGLLVLGQTYLFGQTDLSAMVKTALFLHVGTFLAAIVYFRREIISLAKLENKKLVHFLLISTLISGGLGFLLLKTIVSLESSFEITGKFITGLVASLLIITGILQIRNDNPSHRDLKNLNYLDALIFGLVQGLAVLPGFSRSGLTVAVLIFRKIEKVTALKLSFLAGLPIIFAGNILLNIDKFGLNNGYLVGVIVSFIFGLATIHGLLKLVKKINLGYFVTAFGLITLIFSIV